MEIIVTPTPLPSPLGLGSIITSGAVGGVAPGVLAGRSCEEVSGTFLEA